MTELTTHILAWVGQHAHWAYLVVFLTAMVEGILLVGLFVPAMPIMFGVGALVSAGSLGLWPALAAAAAGCATGDLLSFWLGRWQHGHLREMWPMSRYPALFDQAQRFFERHGGKSVVMGRFIGPIRPVLPAVAGMARMSPLRFVIADLAAAVAWAPAYILPGVLFASSLGLAAEIGTRLVVLIALLGGVLFAVVWLISQLVDFVEPHAETWINALLQWSSRHRRLGVIGTSLADPRQPELRGLALLTVILVAAAIVLTTVLWSLGGTGPHALDRTVLRLFEGLHTPWATALFLHLSLAADWQVYLPVLAAGALYLLFRGHRATAGHWVAALAPTLVFSLGTALWLHGTPAGGDATGPWQSVANGGAIWSFLAVILGQRALRRWRWTSYALIATLVVFMAIARLYLGLQWPTPMVIGLILALVWTSLLAVAYRRHFPRPVARPALIAVVLPVFAAAAALHWHEAYSTRLARLRPAPAQRTISMARWWAGGWKALPAFRSDLGHLPAQRLDIQWAGTLPAIRRSLRRHGWREPTPLTPRSVLRALSSNPPVDQLPVLPRMHDGRTPALMLTHAIDPTHQQVLFLWASGVRLQPPGTPVWIGTLGQQARGRALYTVAYARLQPDRVTDVRRLAGELQSWSTRRLPDGAGNGGPVLLVRPHPRVAPTAAAGSAPGPADPARARP
ncbi:MAG TPA: VTT domain-containing protein [Gammaproteobacteria bacterium]|nr:VTT domain-containing protein [Gammaproteobacteria bacterium]